MATMDDKLFNLDLIITNKENTKNLSEIKSLLIFEPNTQIFHKEGLFSTEIFGAVGSPERLLIPGYIDLKVKILHPLVFRTLYKYRAAYANIIDGKVKARFDNSIGDFVIDKDGKETGYAFFVSNLHKLKYESTGSSQRDYKIKLLTKYGNRENMFDRLITLPAGIRDYTIDSKGKPSEDAINSLYRRVMSAANTVKNIKLLDDNDPSFNVVRLSIQKSVLAIYEHIENLLYDKGGFVQSVWASRNITNATRNVITSTPTTITDLDKKNRISLNHTTCGLFQYIKAILPIAVNKVISTFVSYVMQPDNDLGNLIDPKTKNSSLVKIPQKTREKWLTTDGLNKLFNTLLQDVNMRSNIVVDDKYMAMVWDRGSKVDIIFDTNNLPEGCKLNDLRPITYAEMIYISIFSCIDKYPGYVTRFPAIEEGSIYPCKIYVKTTMHGRDVKLRIHGMEIEMPEYPILKEEFLRSMNVNFSHLKTLGGDFDGDTTTLTILYTEESIKEIEKKLGDFRFYIKPDGKIIYSASNDVIDLVLKHLTAPKPDSNIKIDLKNFDIDAAAKA